MKTNCIRLRRKGVILPFAAIMMVMMLAFIAFAVDLGYLALVRTQLQSAADAAALAGTVDLLENRLKTTPLTTAEIEGIATSSAEYCVANNVIAGSTANRLGEGDVTLGRMSLGGSSGTMTFGDPSRFNAVQVTVKRSAAQNGEVPMFFARVLGIDSRGSQATATAAYADNFQGFRVPGQGDANLPILPFTLDKQTWDQLLAGQTADNWGWTPSTKRIGSGSDGAREANMYPQGTGSPGNRGTVDIGNPNNSTRDLGRQIRDGVSAEDLSYVPGGSLVPGDSGTIQLTGDTGMSVGIKSDLAAIIGETRVIPIFSKVGGNGNNATYTIVQFVGVRVMAVNLTGNPGDRYVIVQPANMQIDNGVPAPDGSQFSQFLFSKNVWLVH